MVLSVVAFAKSITVGTFAELMAGINSASGGDTILMKDGTYTIDNGYGVQVRKNDLVIKSLSNNRNKVVVTGGGMTSGSNYGFWIPGHRVTIQGITIEQVKNHCIQTDVDNHRLRVIDCVLRDAYEQFLKVPAGSGTSDSGLVEGCLFEFTKGVGENYYTGGIDCHRSKDWIVRNNSFKNIRSPGGAVAEHAIHFWNNCQNITVENNLIIDCDRGIGFGLGNENIQQGGLIRNNMVYHREISGTDFGDVGIALENCRDIGVYNNTIFFDNNYTNAIEYRFTGSTGISIQNNLTNRRIQMRDGASGTVVNNCTTAEATWFVAPASGNLHLGSGSIITVIDKGVPVADVVTDYDNDRRPQGSGIDIGADEFTNESSISRRLFPQLVNATPRYHKILWGAADRRLPKTIENIPSMAHQRFTLNGAVLPKETMQPGFSVIIDYTGVD